MCLRPVALRPVAVVVLRQIVGRLHTARIRSVLRRLAGQLSAAAPSQTESQVLRFSGWTLDLSQREVITPDAEQVALTFHEFELLAVLAQRSGRVISRDQLLELIANRHWQPFDRSIDVLVGKLRRKLNDDPRSPHLIKTVRGVGYIFTPQTTSG